MNKHFDISNGHNNADKQAMQDPSECPTNKIQDPQESPPALSVLPEFFMSVLYAVSFQLNDVYHSKYLDR
jgi:hypothetical protein